MRKQQSFKSLSIIGWKTTVKKKITYWPITSYARQTTTATTAGGAKNSHQFGECHTVSPQNPSQHQEFLPISRSFSQSIQEDSCNGNGNAVDAFCPSSSKSLLVSPIQTSIHDSNLSSNSKSKAKRGCKGIINEKQWRSDEIMQLISMWEQKEELYNATSPDYSIREKRSKAIKEIAEKLDHFLTVCIF